MWCLSRLGFPAMLLLLVSAPPGAVADTTIPSAMSKETAECIECHATETVGIYQEWGTSKHYRANVGCFECHSADKNDPDAFDHNGHLVSIIVSPKDCSRCHPREVKEFDESHHAKAGQILGSLDNFLADIVEGNWEFYGGSALTVSEEEKAKRLKAQRDFKKRYGK
ncbi:MAG: multiheme c-type cytochrome [Candidatus Krumholzibacteria bacterium]